MGGGARLAIAIAILFLAMVCFFFAFHPGGVQGVSDPNTMLQWLMGEFQNTASGNQLGASAITNDTANSPTAPGVQVPPSATAGQTTIPGVNQPSSQTQPGPPAVTPNPVTNPGAFGILWLLSLHRIRERPISGVSQPGLGLKISTLGHAQS